MQDAQRPVWAPVRAQWAEKPETLRVACRAMHDQKSSVPERRKASREYPRQDTRAKPQCRQGQSRSGGERTPSPWMASSPSVKQAATRGRVTAGNQQTDSGSGLTACQDGRTPPGRPAFILHFPQRPAATRHPKAPGRRTRLYAFASTLGLSTTRVDRNVPDASKSTVTETLTSFP